jgi:hypothetical protein
MLIKWDINNLGAVSKFFIKLCGGLRSLDGVSHHSMLY